MIVFRLTSAFSKTSSGILLSRTLDFVVTYPTSPALITGNTEILQSCTRLFSFKLPNRNSLRNLHYESKKRHNQQKCILILKHFDITTVSTKATFEQNFY